MKAFNPENPPVMITDSEVKKILDVCKREAAIDMMNRRTTWPRRYFLVWMAFNSGLRLSELTALRFEDLDIPGMKVFSSGRTAELLDFDMTLFDQYLATQQYTHGSDFVFSNKKGAPCSGRALEISFKNAVVKAGITAPVSIKDARGYYSHHFYTTRTMSEVVSNLGCLMPAVAQAHMNPRIKGMTKDYNLYVLYSSQQKAVKIGVTKNLQDRLLHYYTHNPSFIEVVRYYPKKGSMETVLLKTLAEYKLNGEWFKETALPQIDIFMKQNGVRRSFLKEEYFPSRQKNLFAKKSYGDSGSPYYMRKELFPCNT